MCLVTFIVHWGAPKLDEARKYGDAAVSQIDILLAMVVARLI